MSSRVSRGQLSGQILTDRIDDQFGPEIDVVMTAVGEDDDVGGEAGQPRVRVDQVAGAEVHEDLHFGVVLGQADEPVLQIGRDGGDGLTDAPYRVGCQVGQFQCDAQERISKVAVAGLIPSQLEIAE